MDHVEAITLLDQELARFRDEPYDQLVARISEEPVTMEVAGPSGVKYQVEILAVWDGGPGGDVRVIGAVDDGGWRAFMPLTSDFIKAPDGSFVGE